VTLFYYGSSGDLNTNRIRLGTGFSLTEAAEAGVLAMSRVGVDDPAGNLNIVGHHSFRATETACSWPTLFRGYFADRTIKRAESMLTGAARRWDCTVYDINAALQFEVIRGTSAQRPAETDTERLEWLLGSGFLGPISSDDGAIFGADEELDKQDYRGMTAADVLSDCGQASGCNYFVAWDETVGAPIIHYYLPTRAFNSSTLRISNVLGDVDGLTVFAPDKDAELLRDPSLVYSGVLYQYGDRASAFVYETNPTVLAAIGHKRETTHADPSLSSAAKATRKATVWLSESEDETDVISVVLHKVPTSQVNLIRAGQRIEVKFTHLPGYEAYTWMRVQRRTVAQDGDTQEYYALTLQLSNPKQGGSGVRHKPGRHPDGTVTTDGSSITLTQREMLNRFDGFALDPLSDIQYGNPVTKRIGSWVYHNLPYTTTGCPIGAGGWSGIAEYEGWYEFTTGALADNVIGVRFTIDPANPTFIYGNAEDQPYFYGWRAAQPTDVGQYVPVGTVDWVSAGAVVDLPRSAIQEGGTSYFCLAPGWRAAAEAFFCAQDLADGTAGPAGSLSSGGEGNSGNLRMPTVTATYLIMSGSSGLSPWTPGDGAIDGVNRTFTLTGWDGTGAPQVKINGLVADGTDYEYSDTALTVTLRVAPQEGDQVTFRYQAGT